MCQCITMNVLHEICATCSSDRAPLFSQQGDVDYSRLLSRRHAYLGDFCNVSVGYTGTGGKLISSWRIVALQWYIMSAHYRDTMLTTTVACVTVVHETHEFLILSSTWQASWATSPT